MITRAQAEALLTLAESLEACEREDLKLMLSPRGFELSHNFHLTNVAVYELTGLSIRLAVNALIPKQET
ncbi:hypothetical protein D3C80_1182100 [compost metagenome]